MKFFSPNGDGINDRWKILGVSADFQPQSQIYIFDRYGRLITEISPSEEGWDGTLNYSLLPQDDYWFRVFFQDGRQYSGHFSLLRSR
jgi:gliding motility-associated-like protein